MDARRCFSLLILLPVLGASFAKLSPAVPAMVRPGSPPASLAFDQYLVNLRNMGLQPTLSAEFRFTNTGEVPITITKLEPSCGCLTPQLAADKRSYEPGERGMFRVDVATANEEAGAHSYTVNVKYTDPRPQEAMVRFKLTLPERKVSVNPPELAFFQYNGQPSQRDIHVTDYRGSALQVTGASSSSEVVSVEVLPADTDEAGHHRVPVRLRVPGRVPPGRQLTTVTITTSDPEFSVIRIPVLVDGPTQPAGEIELIGAEAPADEPASAEAE